MDELKKIKKDIKETYYNMIIDYKLKKINEILKDNLKMKDIESIIKTMKIKEGTAFDNSSGMTIEYFLMAWDYFLENKTEKAFTKYVLNLYKSKNFRYSTDYRKEIKKYLKKLEVWPWIK